MFGPDGKPIQVGAPIIGAPRSLDDIEVFNDATIDEFAAGADQMLSQGLPPEVPAAMPMGQIAQCAKTMKALRDRVKELEALLSEGEPEGQEAPPLPDLSALLPG